MELLPQDQKTAFKVGQQERGFFLLTRMLKSCADILCYHATNFPGPWVDQNFICSIL